MNSIRNQMLKFKNKKHEQSFRHDPRPDIEEDHKYWKLVLKEAEKIDKELYFNLHGFRCVGAKLELDSNGFNLLSGPEVTDYWQDKSEWQASRKEFLFPYTNEIKQLFAEVYDVLQ